MFALLVNSRERARVASETRTNDAKKLNNNDTKSEETENAARPREIDKCEMLEGNR